MFSYTITAIKMKMTMKAIHYLGIMFEFFCSSFYQLQPVLEIEGAILLELFTDGGDAEIGCHLAQEVRLLRQQYGHDMWFLGKNLSFLKALPR
jgi:hypothetical protein